MDKRFIEDSFPVKEVSKESAREKRIRHGHISTLHLWWARRPLASSRATNYAALIPEISDEDTKEKIKNFIINLSKWENSLDQNCIEKARQDILDANGGIPPKVLDPFSGGGAIPLEASRLGCEAYANDYNPVAVLIEKCTLEYPQIYGRTEKWSENENLFNKSFEKWGNIVLENVKQEIGKFYPEDKDGYVPVGYIWSRTVPCQNPSCESEIPLIRQYWLSKNRKIAFKPLIKKNQIEFEIVGQDNEIPPDFDPSDGTIEKGIGQCPICGSMIDGKRMKELFQSNKSGEKMLIVVLNHPQKRGKKYRIALNEDIEIFKNAEKYLQKKRKYLFDKWGIDPIPDEDLPPYKSHRAVGSQLPLYNLKSWGELFNSRQKLALITFTEKLKDLNNVNFEREEYKIPIITYLSFALDKLASFNTRHGFWLSIGEKATQIFARQALPMLWDYVETNPLSNSFSWKSQLKWISLVVKHIVDSDTNPSIITNSSSTNLSYPDNYFDAVFTDPPYYDNVPYSYLSDFFYVWLKRIIGDFYPDYFLTPLTPKTEEIVVYSNDSKNKEEHNKFFEDMLKKSFQEIYRVLKPNGIATIVYAHKTTKGWETVINSLLDSGLIVTASWPISTEMQLRVSARNTASLSSSIYIVTRKIEKKDIGWYNEVKEEIKNYIPKKLEKLWNEGISGADFFIAAIGSAIEVFGKYEKIIDFEGNEIRADKLLSFVRDVVTDYAVRHILHNGIADELSPLTKFYLLWRWNYQEAKVPFDEARKLAQSAGIDLANEWNKGFIKKQGGFIVVKGPEKRKESDLDDSRELIDILHYSLILWKEDRKKEMNVLLQSSGWINREAFYKVAQAISETLTSKSREKSLLDGFLSSKTMIDEYDDKSSQTKLFEI